ncbi:MULTISPECIES: FAD-dependent oxidoreductase [unclassified Nocardioides]|uniref:FAD-dependent oxidoreductase n=1 Tax=unclassified Nocardioides TaxID=2615069 RepID=UPI0006F561C1|nr:MULTISPECIES: FAD-dependent oxidoreductase [unclassified Nocardioides]KRA38340.1 pyridine nucleotide-disulfide oxidoreductase [Nocardioides sp. Root614]KRA92299.1 pyridine nucleotide-disulfide oxidoreductase [Nocardioides sp. Root682]
MTRPRVVVAGLGDTGLLTAIHLARHRGVEVVGISSKPGLVSGQELGLRLARPDDWQRNYRVGFDQFRRLRGVRTVHAELVGLDVEARTVLLRRVDGTDVREPYDVLVISTGVSNGFWRRPHVQTEDDVDLDLARQHRTMADASTVVVVGGGAAAVSSALQIATRWPEKAVALCFPGARALPQHHPRTWDHVRRRLLAAGVDLRPGHRAVLPNGFTADRITTEELTWSTGQSATPADAVLWAIGRVSPNTGWLPPGLLDEAGFVRADLTLQTPEHPEIFAIGDVAATDPLRSSARARADGLLASNIRAHLTGRELKAFRPVERRWGSVLGVEADGLRVFAPNGRPFRFPAWSVRAVLQPWIVDRGIYGGIRRR